MCSTRLGFYFSYQQPRSGWQWHKSSTSMSRQKQHKVPDTEAKEESNKQPTEVVRSCPTVLLSFSLTSSQFKLITSLPQKPHFSINNQKRCQSSMVVLMEEPHKHGTSIKKAKCLFSPGHKVQGLHPADPCACNFVKFLSKHFEAKV